jgi:serine/threonine-protein kinase SRPK3
MHLKNFLLFSPVFDKDSADVEQLYNHVGTPITVPVRRANGIINLPSAPFYSPHVPRYCVPPIEAHRPGDSVTNAKIVINDFSRSFPQRERHAVRTPVRFLAPETMFEGVSGQPADVWGLACSIFEILGDFHLFPVYGDDWDELIMMMIRTIGWIPDDWWRRWTTRGNYFRDDGTFVRPTRFFPTRFWVGLGVRIVTMRLSPHPGQVAFGREEIDALEDMLKGMMRYRPWHRSTASEAAASRWMQEWSRVGYFNGH